MQSDNGMEKVKPSQTSTLKGGSSRQHPVPGAYVTHSGRGVGPTALRARVKAEVAFQPS